MTKPFRHSKPLKRIFETLYRFYGPQGWWPADTKFEVIVGAILTQNTAWANVEKAISNLKAANALSSNRLFRDLSTRKIASLIRPAGYYNVKALRLKHFTRFLQDKYAGSLTALSRRKTGGLRKELLAVNGIGPETCDSILLYAFARPVFVIDAYTRRVFSRHKFFKEDIGYDDAQRFFMANLPKERALFNEFHALIVRLAKDFCKIRPRCALCPLKGMKLLANRQSQ